MDEAKVAEMLRDALSELFVWNDPDNGLTVGGQARAAKKLMEAIKEAARPCEPT